MSAIPEQQPQIAQPTTAVAEPPVVDPVDASSTCNETAAEGEPAGAGVTEMDLCAVCTFVDDKYPRAYLPCGHSMHPACIKGWVETLSDQSLAHAPGAGSVPGVISAASVEDLPPPTCPLCRASIVYSCGHAARATEFDAGAIAADHWNQLCVDCLDDEHGYDGLDDDGDDDDEDKNKVKESGESQSNGKPCACY